MSNLTSLGRQIRAHWLEHRPKMAAELSRAGQLDRAVYAAQERTRQAVAEAVEKGQPYREAFESLSQEWAFLPTEEDQPTLANGHPREWSGPEPTTAA